MPPFHVAGNRPGQSIRSPDAPFVYTYLARGRTHLEGAETLDAGEPRTADRRWAVPYPRPLAQRSADLGDASLAQQRPSDDM
jgi:hypothetical protein